ncbi:Class I triheme cytochrome c [Limimaricola hongkongensis DSM 17492]|uniref:Class I triheme cytochrome c n=1 Tax=Limimaricola hongkongensis DSM 17492 TaxID=1122180 RepID=A0A017HEA7_9RHOB|nr:Class I triheme cytochrome c [Limimaricola hongkongensis DSM 17492]
MAVLAGLGAVAGGATVAFGLYNVSARAGHLPPVRWALHTTYRNAVDLYSGAPETPAPDLRDPALIELGARHFETACAMCHAMPGRARSATVRGMNPPPPHITDAVGGWSPEELHWIVFEGVKMSGMPPWPSSREDDVWAVVAYLRAIQTGAVTPARQAGITARAQMDGPEDAAWCAGCHGGTQAHVPRLDIFETGYIEAALMAYREGRRESGIMQHAASRLRPEQLSELAEWFARGAASPGRTTAAAPDLLAQGETLARAGTDDVPACTACHGPGPRDLSGLGGEDPKGRFPPLAGQDEAYLITQLRLWRDGVRGGTEAFNLMRVAARELKEADIAALAAWYASLDPSERTQAGPGATKAAEDRGAAAPDPLRQPADH